MTAYGRIYGNLSPPWADCLETRMCSEPYTWPTTTFTFTCSPACCNWYETI